MKITKAPLLSLVVILSACQSSPAIKSETHFLFDSFVNVAIKDGTDEDFKNIKDILEKYDAVSDNFKKREVINVYSWSQTEEKIYFGSGEDKAPIELLNLIRSSFNAVWDGARNLDPRLGSLINKWKEAEKQGQVLEDSVIQEELQKRSLSSFSFHYDDENIEECFIEQSGVSSFDYGATAKGCALDACKRYLDTKEELTDYLINGGSSSILLGTNSRNKSGDYLIKIKELESTSFYAQNCFVSTSGTSEQGVTINGVRYSHIINPSTGSAVTNYDEVIVISDNGTYGDAFSTSMMYNTIDEIKDLDEKLNLKTIVIKDKEVFYKNKGIILK